MTSRSAERRPGGTQWIPRPTEARAVEGIAWAERVGAVDLAVDTVSRALRPPEEVVAVSAGEGRPSAVLVVLADGAHGAEVLLTKRSMHLSNHRGEISFPGGRVDQGETVVDAALREAHEEVALDPSRVEVVGGLQPISTIVSNSHIVPLVARVESKPDLVAHAAEVDRILWVPIAELARPDTYRAERWGTPPRDRDMHFFDLDDETIWGATGRMLYELVARAHGVEPHMAGWW